MKIYDVINRVLDEAPGVGIRGLIADVDLVLGLIWGHRHWRFQRSSLLFRPVRSTSNATVNNESSLVTDGATNWDAGYTGGTATIVTDTESGEYTILATTGSQNILLTTNWTGESQAGGVSVTLEQRLWPLPADFLSARELMEVSTVNSPRLDLIWRNGESWVVNPEEEVIQLFQVPSAGTYLRLEYLRTRTKATGPESTVDVPEWLEDALVQGVLKRLYAREDPEKFMVRYREADARYQELLAVAVRRDAREERPETRNRLRGIGVE